MFATTAIVEINDDNCVGCRRCVNVCPADALHMEGKLAVLEAPKCVGCFKCIEACGPYEAISAARDPNPRLLTMPAEQRDESAANELCARARLSPSQDICLCTNTTAGEVAAAIIAGTHEPEELTLQTGVRAKCGMWCISPTMRLLNAAGVELTRSPKDHRLYPDGAGNDVAIWTIPDEVADKYPEYRLRENLAAVEDGTILNNPTPLYPDILPGGAR